MRDLLPEGVTLAEMALRFFLSHPAVMTIIAGTRSVDHLLANLRVADGNGLPPELRAKISAIYGDFWWHQLAGIEKERKK